VTIIYSRRTLLCGVRSAIALEISGFTDILLFHYSIALYQLLMWGVTAKLKCPSDHARSELLTAATTHMHIFWDIASCNPEKANR
jgi:hypothetical protein